MQWMATTNPEKAPSKPLNTRSKVFFVFLKLHLRHDRVMFWSKKSKEEKAAKAKAEKSEKLRAEAMENVRAAREAIGEETLERIAAAMTKKQQSAVERAKAQINQSDSEKVKDGIMSMLDDE